VEIRELDPHDEALVHRHWEIGRAAEAAYRPYDDYPAWESTWAVRSQGGKDHLETVLLGAFEDGLMWGAAVVEHPRYDNLHAAYAQPYVHPDRQRRGIGTALVEATYGVARARGRRVVMCEAYAPVDGTSAGLLFAEALGFSPAIEEGVKLVDLPATEELWDELAARAAAKQGDYRVVTWLDRLPDDLMADYCRLGELFIQEAPMGDLDVEPEHWDEARVRRREEANARQGRREVCAGALAPDGTLVALTEATVNEHSPWRGFQSGTLVDPAHRGHALGLAIKVANHRQLREHFPECQVLITGNADVNAPMNAVNETLGYRLVERCVELQRDL
jgi:GNAT superfamily N-acetyltransferase